MHLQEVLNLSSTTLGQGCKMSPFPKIVFTSSDMVGIIVRHDDPMVILTMMANAEVKRALIN